MFEWSGDNGQPVSSGRPIPAEGASPHVGITLRLPVYLKGMSHNTVDQRQRAYIGSAPVVQRLFRMGHPMFQCLIARIPSDSGDR